ncbi:HTH_38 domain-containing protein [Trichonephila clavipes]|nr:HTH_38 domain-containing protein [Trichonephila clavipes]
MLGKNAFFRRRSHNQQLTEFGRGHVIGLRKGEFSFHDIAERLGWNVSPVHDCREKWSRDSIASRRPSFWWSRDTTESEDRRFRRMAVARVIFNLLGALSTPNCYVPHLQFPEHPSPSVLTSSVSVHEGFSLVVSWTGNRQP